MPYLLRVELPDVAGSLGRVATAIGEAGGDIEAIEIVEHRSDGTAVDDFLLETAAGVLPDSLVSACSRLDGVTVLWISRYTAGGNILLDLEAVEELTDNPAEALNRLVDLLPVTFRVDWAARVRRVGDEVTTVHRTPAAPDEVDWVEVEHPTRVPGNELYERAVAPLGDDEIVVVARRGGPVILDSEIARLGHLAGLAVSIARTFAGSRTPRQ